MKNTIIEILHHNRDRDRLIKSVKPFLNDMMNEDIATALFSFDFLFEIITPKDESQIVFDDYIKYIDEDIAENDVSCIYNIYDSIAVIKDLVSDIERTSAINNPTLKSWLNDRGVSDHQIMKWNLIDISHIQKYNIFQQNATGATIHPSLRHWITDKDAMNGIPTGIMTPVSDLHGNIMGCHNRFLSTVPKIKFASSIPNFHLFTNLKSGMRYEEIFIVEGVFDALAIEKMDSNVGWIAPSSGFWTQEQFINLVSMLGNFKDSEIICCFDNDRVGLKSNILLCHALRGANFNSEIMNFMGGAKDPGEAINKYEFTEEDLKIIRIPDAIRKFKTMEYSPLKKFEDYLDHRHASYSVDNYQWIKKK